MLRKTNTKDIKSILQIIDEGKKYLKENNIPQWQDGYPNEDTILDDIKKGYSYVYEVDGEILGTAAVIIGKDKDYDKIYEGNWITANNEYIVVHRIAVKKDCKGKRIASKIFNEILNIAKEKNIESIRVDTHRLNKSMQNSLLKNNFKYCGIVYLSGKDERFAFEKTVK